MEKRDHCEIGEDTPRCSQQHAAKELVFTGGLHSQALFINHRATRHLAMALVMKAHGYAWLGMARHGYAWLGMGRVAEIRYPNIPISQYP